jgi:hypothetical protein
MQGRPGENLWSFLDGLQPFVYSCQPFELCFFLTLPNFADCLHGNNSTFRLCYLSKYKEANMKPVTIVYELRLCSSQQETQTMKENSICVRHCKTVYRMYSCRPHGLIDVAHLLGTTALYCCSNSKSLVRREQRNLTEVNIGMHSQCYCFLDWSQVSWVKTVCLSVIQGN